MQMSPFALPDSSDVAKMTHDVVVLLLRATIWLAVCAWAATEGLRSTRQARRALARAVWTAGALLLAVHTAIAFQFWHGWSHVAAIEATAQQSAALTGVAAGWGLYLNYALVLVWLGDAVWWWRDPGGYQARSRALDTGIFVFFLFMMINGAVVFATSPMRLAGALAVALAIAARIRRRTLR